MRTCYLKLLQLINLSKNKCKWLKADLILDRSAGAKDNATGFLDSRSRGERGLANLKNLSGSTVSRYRGRTLEME